MPRARGFVLNITSVQDPDDGSYGFFRDHQIAVRQSHADIFCHLKSGENFTLKFERKIAVPAGKARAGGAVFQNYAGVDFIAPLFRRRRAERLQCGGARGRQPVVLCYEPVRPYAYGGASPEEGFDCSGLVMYVYQQFGISLPHTASGQLAALEKYGSRFVTDPDDLRYGDLVFFPGHVAFYVGDGEVFCAKVPGEPAGFGKLSWYGTFLGGGQF